MQDLENEFPELEKWNRSGETNSFYTDMGPMKKPYDSSNVLGDLNLYTYRLDSSSHNVIRTRIK